jgi:hypothetical protein
LREAGAMSDDERTPDQKRKEELRGKARHAVQPRPERLRATKLLAKANGPARQLSLRTLCSAIFRISKFLQSPALGVGSSI